jgi:glutathione S-transferase
MLRLLGRISSINVRKVLWTCSEIGLQVEREDWGGDFASTRSPEFLALNPHGLIPVLVDEDGPVWESNVICRYLANRHRRQDLLPEAPRARALVEQWMDWQVSDYSYAGQYAFLGLVRKNPAYQDPALIRKSIENWNEQIKVIELHLAGKGDFLTGESFTLADIVVGLSVNRWLRTPQNHPDFPSVDAYFSRVSARPAFQQDGLALP